MRFSVHGENVIAARDGDAILGPGEFVHQPVELLVGFQVRVVLDDDEQPGERLGLLVRRRDRVFRRPGAREPRARVRDRLEHVALVSGVALHGLDQVRDEIVATL